MKLKTLFPVLFLFGAAGTLVGCNGGGHTHNYGDLVTKVDPTCIEDGHEAYYHCEGCNKYFNENKEEKTFEELTIAALGHDWQKVTGRLPTCTEDGYKDYYDCSRCDLYAEDSSGTVTFTDLEAWKKGKGKLDAAHDLEWVDGQDETCLADGWEGYYECQICNKCFEDEDALVPIEDLEKWKIDPNGGLISKHVDALTLNDKEEATCLKDGHQAYYSCSKCNKCYEDKDGKQPIDDIDEWLAGEGKIAKHVDALTLVPGTAKTCTTDGYKDAYKCAQCNTYYEDEDATKNIGDEAAYNAWKTNGGKIPASHTLTEHPAVPATGFNPGNTLYYSCADCGKYFSDAAGTNEIAADSWITEPLKTVTFDSVEQFNANTSKEGDTLTIDKYNIGTEDGYVCSLEQGTGVAPTQYDGYLVFGDMKGATELTIKGTGKVCVRTAVTAWSWETLAHFTLNENDGITLKLDPERCNAVYFASFQGRTLIKSFAMKTALETATGSTDSDLLQHAIINEGSTSAEAYGYFTGENTNNSKSALVLGVEHIGTDQAWPCVWITLPEVMTADELYGHDFQFDAKGVTGRKRVSFTPINESCAPVGNEIGYDLTDSWQTFNYSCNSLTGDVKYIRFTIFVNNDDALTIHENVIDNLFLVYNLKKTETNAAAWSYRELGAREKLQEAAYTNKAVAIDFKPETASATFEIDFMSDSNTYVGKKNYINVTDYVPTSTFGTITPKGDGGWYTLTVSSYNICANTRLTNGTINGIYLATNDPMTGSVTFDYGSFRAVDDIAPTRREQVVDATHEGISIWGDAVNDTVTMEEFKRTQNNEFLVDVKVSGDVGTTVTMNLANEGDTTGQKIFASITLTVTDGGLSTNVGCLVKAVGDGWYHLIIKNSECDAATLEAAENTSYLTVLWCNNTTMTINSITFDKNSAHVYAPGILPNS